MDYVILIFRLIFALIFIFGLIIVFYKYSNKGINKINEKKYIKVIERIQISRDSSIIIIQIGEEGQVLLSSIGHTKVLKELTKEQLEKIQNDKKESYEEMTEAFNKVIKKIRLKEKRHEEIE